jgi:hypothetical protein
MVFIISDLFDFDDLLATDFLTGSVSTSIAPFMAVVVGL